MTDFAEKLAGRFIVLDGPDGSGKSTQLAMLDECLRACGVKVVTTRDPGGTAIGDKIRGILLDRANDVMSINCEILLYMASRTQLMAEVISPAAASGNCVLCDRWVSSTVAYQVADGKASAADIMAAYDLALPGVCPDLTIILDLDAEFGLARAAGAGGHDRIEARGAKYHRRVRELFLEQATGQPGRFAVVDAADTIDQIHQRVRNVIETWEFDRA